MIWNQRLLRTFLFSLIPLAILYSACQGFTVEVSQEAPAKQGEGDAENGQNGSSSGKKDEPQIAVTSEPMGDGKLHISICSDTPNMELLVPEELLAAYCAQGGDEKGLAERFQIPPTVALRRWEDPPILLN